MTNHTPYQNDAVVSKRTEEEMGLTDQEIVDSITYVKSDGVPRTVIFESEDSEVSWTIQEIAFDNNFIRLRGTWTR